QPSMYDSPSPSEPCASRRVHNRSSRGCRSHSRSPPILTSASASSASTRRLARNPCPISVLLLREQRPVLPGHVRQQLRGRHLRILYPVGVGSDLVGREHEAQPGNPPVCCWHWLALGEVARVRLRALVDHAQRRIQQALALLRRQRA